MSCPVDPVPFQVNIVQPVYPASRGPSTVLSFAIWILWECIAGYIFPSCMEASLQSFKETLISCRDSSLLWIITLFSWKKNYFIPIASHIKPAKWTDQDKCFAWFSYFIRIKGNPGDCISVQLLHQAKVLTYGCWHVTEQAYFTCRHSHMAFILFRPIRTFTPKWPLATTLNNSQGLPLLLDGFCSPPGLKMSSKIVNQTSLVAQWLRIRLPMQGTQVRALIREDPTCRRAAKPVRHNYWACALEPASHNYQSPCT